MTGCWPSSFQLLYMYSIPLQRRTHKNEWLMKPLSTVKESIRPGSKRIENHKLVRRKIIGFSTLAAAAPSRSRYDMILVGKPFIKSFKTNYPAIYPSVQSSNHVKKPLFYHFYLSNPIKSYQLNHQGFLWVAVFVAIPGLRTISARVTELPFQPLLSTASLVKATRGLVWEMML